MNKSEQLLEDWCSKVGWLWEKIPKEENSRTADYRINISSIKIYAEVKEILANDEEKKVIKQLEDKGFSDAYGEEPGKTVRNKIQDSYKQIKRFTEPEKCSGILVLYNNSGMDGLGRLSHYNILTGMFGLQTVPIKIPKDSSKPLIYGADYLGAKKSVTPNHSRYLSGIATLYEHYEKGLMIFFYHNPYAIYPIDTNLINVKNCVQYRVSSVELNWELVKFTK